MSDEMTAKEISEAWIKYVDDTFMVENGCGRPDVDEKFKRLWGYYLSYCEAGFRAGSINVTQVALAKP